MMTDRLREDSEWFAPKRYGYGSGLPMAWQGWVLCAAYLAALAAIGWIAAIGIGWLRIASLPLFVMATTAFIVTASRHTRGGWKWRWGKE